MPTHRITYYALRESDEPQATGLFRDVWLDGGNYLERLDASGAWVEDNELLRYLMGESGAVRVDGAGPGSYGASVLFRALPRSSTPTPAVEIPALASV